jgi:hypothetical protein
VGAGGGPVGAGGFAAAAGFDGAVAGEVGGASVRRVARQAISSARASSATAIAGSGSPVCLPASLRTRCVRNALPSAVAPASRPPIGPAQFQPTAPLPAKRAARLAGSVRLGMLGSLSAASSPAEARTIVVRSRRDCGRRSRRAIVAAGTNVRIPPAMPRPIAAGRPRRVRRRVRDIAGILDFSA